MATMGRTIFELFIVGVVFVVVYAVFRNALPKECIAMLLVGGFVVFGWIRRQISL